MLTRSLSFTSPEPVPPLMVRDTPIPYRATRLPGASGRIPFSFFRSTIPSAAAFLAAARFFSSLSLISGFRIPENPRFFIILCRISHLLLLFYRFLIRTSSFFPVFITFHPHTFPLPAQTPGTDPGSRC